MDAPLTVCAEAFLDVMTAFEPGVALEFDLLQMG